MAAGEAEAPAPVGTLDRPGQDLVAALGLGDVLVRAPRRGTLALAGGVVGLGHQDRHDAGPSPSGRNRML